MLRSESNVYANSNKCLESEDYKMDRLCVNVLWNISSAPLEEPTNVAVPRVNAIYVSFESHLSVFQSLTVVHVVFCGRIFLCAEVFILPAVWRKHQRHSLIVFGMETQYVCSAVQTSWPHAVQNFWCVASPELKGYFYYEDDVWALWNLSRMIPWVQNDMV